MHATLAPHGPRQRIRTPAGFVVVALLMYLIDGAVVHSPAFAQNPAMLAMAASFDLTVGVTAAYWFLVVRPGHAALRSALPVFIASVAAAALTLPVGYRYLVRDIRYLGIPVELAVMALIIVGVRRTHQQLAAAGAELDVPERIRAALGGSSMRSRIADIMAMEAGLLFYAVASWRRKPFVPVGARAFSYHKASAFAAVLYTLVFASVVEACAVHFLLRAIAPRLALAVLAVSVFGAVWLLGFARSVQLRPVLVTRDYLRVRTGVQWSLDIPRDQIAKIEYGRVKAPAKGTPGYLRAVLGTPNVLLDLREPLTAHGPYGMTRVVQRVGLVIDDLKGLESALR